MKFKLSKNKSSDDLDAQKMSASNHNPINSSNNINDYVIDVKDLNILFKLQNKKLIHIVRGVNFKIKKGQIVGLVGESGSGKTVTSKSFLGVNNNAIIHSSKMIISGIDATNFKKDRDWLKIRGKKVGYIPQDPLTALNPTRTIQNQILDVLVKDPRFKNKQEKLDYIANILETFGIKDARNKMKQYPHTFSGGMKQRVVIAMIVALQPDLIVADEPTTALDPTVQSSVLSLLDKIKNEYGISIIFISHNISVVAKFCDYLYVMYAGRVVERGTKEDIFTNPKHPYTWALINAIPEDSEQRLHTIKGTPPDMANLPAGDPFAPRNEYALEIDYYKEPPLIEISPTHAAATWLLAPNAPKVELNANLKRRLESFRKVFDEKRS